MGTLSRETYRQLSEGVRHVNLNLGQHAEEVSLIPSINPFNGTGLEDIDESTLDMIEPTLREAHELLNSESPPSLSDQLGIHEQHVRDARAGVGLAMRAVESARGELGTC